MRGALRPSYFFQEHQFRGKTLTRSSKLLMAVCFLLMPSALRAQSESSSISAPMESTSTGAVSESSHRGAGDLQFSRDLALTALGGEAGSAEMLATDSPINLDRLCSDPAKQECSGSTHLNSTHQVQQGVRGSESDSSDGVVKPSGLASQTKERSDRNLDIYYRNRREFSLDVGWHPVNIPFIYDFAVGDNYNMTGLKYTLVPIIASLRWHVTNVGWRWIFRGNMDFTFSGSLTAIPRGPETHYYSFDFGIRRNFVYRNWKVVPFFEQRGGIGIINAKEPLGVLFAQGQNLTFTYDLGVGARYNIDSKYSFSAGMNYMHISNGYISEPQFTNYGINVYGPMFGIDMRLGKPHHASQ